MLELEKKKPTWFSRTIPALLASCGRDMVHEKRKGCTMSFIFVNDEDKQTGQREC